MITSVYPDPMKKILVTGAGGFIASHLCEALLRAGNSVNAFVHYNSRNSWGWLEEENLSSHPKIQIFSGDLRDQDSVRNAMHGCDEVFHLGALIGIPYSYTSPLAYVKTNVEGTYNVLEAARELRLSRVVVTSTSEVYGTAQYVPIDEKHPLQPQSPYSASKIGADHLALSYFMSFETPVVVARPFNTFGPRQSARAVIPTIASQLLSGRKSIRLGSLTPIRDLTYVEDTVSGLITISREDRFLGKCVNIGVGDGVSIQSLFDILNRLTESDAKIEEDPQRIRPAKSEVHRLLSNNELLRTTTQWKPLVSLEEGLQKTVDWMKPRLHLYKPELYNV